MHQTTESNSNLAIPRTITISGLGKMQISKQISSTRCHLKKYYTPKLRASVAAVAWANEQPAAIYK
jgi:hypothetical protein